MYRLRCFGTMALEDGGDADFTLRSRKHWALLVYLLAHRGRAFPRERLARLFWDTEPRLARHSLSQALYDIRTTLPGVEFDSSTSQVAAGADDLAYDGEAFEEAVRSDDLSRAVRLYGGRFAPDLEDAGNSDFTRWLEGERQRYRRLAEMALYRHVRESHDRAEWGEMCVSALRLLNMNPLSEDAHRALMRGLWLQGDRAAAVRHFEEVEDFLRRELPGGIGRETLDLVERIRTNDRATAAPDDDRRREMVGREEEFGVLRASLEELREEGRGGLVRVHGEAGMGKTRLLEEFRSLVELDGVRLLESRCYAAESDVPYGPVVEALHGLAEEAAAADGDGEPAYHQLGHLFPEAFDPPPESRDAFAKPDAGRRRLYEEAADLLRRAADRAPLVWLLEDVHWVDPSSASLLHYLVRRLDGSPVLVVATARTHEEVDGPARELLEDEPGALPAVVDVELDPLGREETAKLVRAAGESDLLPETVDRIHLLAGGNPFYALELLQASESLERDDVREVLDNGSKGLITRSLRTLLERRIRGLPTDAARIMEAVAVAGRHATSPLVREVTEFPPSRIVDLAGALYDRGLLRDVDGRLEFLHDITRDFVYARLGDLQRSALHLSVGERLEDRENAADPATLARHFRRGGERSRAYGYALEAAREAERRHAHDEAIRMGKMALDLAEGEKEEAEALQTLGMAQYSASRFDQACETFQRLQNNISPQLYDRKAVSLAAAKGFIEQYKWKAAHRELDMVREFITDWTPTQAEGTGIQAKALHLRLKASMMSNSPTLANEVLDEINRFRESTPTDTRTPDADAMLACSVAAYEMFIESAGEAASRLAKILERNECSPSLRMKTELLYGIAQNRLANWNESARAFQRCAASAQEYNDIWYGVQCANNLMCLYMDQGLWSEAEKYYTTAERLGKRLPREFEPLIYPRMNMADMIFSQGHYNKAAKQYRTILSQWKKPLRSSNIADSIRAGLGLCKLATGDYDEALAIHGKLGIDSWDDMLAMPERNIISWFHGYMLWQRDSGQAIEFMEEAVEKDLSVHIVSALRTLWLLELFASEEGSPHTNQFGSEKRLNSMRNRLREVNSGWFTWSSRRWLKAARQRRPGMETAPR